MPSNRLEVLLTGSAKPLNDAFKAAQQAADDALGQIAAKAQSVSVALAGVAAGGAAMGTMLLKEAASAETFQNRLIGVTGSLEAARSEYGKLLEHAKTSPFSMPELMEVRIQLGNMKVDFERLGQASEAIAAQTGKSFQGLAEAAGKAAIGQSEGLQSLAENAGITKERLIAAGAAMDQNGEIALKGSIAAQKFVDAYVKIASESMPALERQGKSLTGMISTLGDVWEQAFAKIGATKLDFAKQIIGQLTAAGEYIGSFSATTKDLIGQGLLVGTVAAGIGATVLGMAAAFGPAIAAMTLAGSSIAGLSGAAAAIPLSFGPAGLAIAAVTYGVVQLIKITNEQTAANEALLKTQLKQVDLYRQERDVIAQAADAVRRYGSDSAASASQIADSMRSRGKTDMDVTKAIIGLREAQRAAEEAGNAAKVAEIESEIQLLTKVRAQLAGLFEAREKEKQAAIDAEKAKQTAAQQTVDRFKENQASGTFVNKRAELAALDEVLAAVKRGSSDEKKFSSERTKLAREARQEEAKEAKELIEAQSALGKISKEEEARQLRALAEKFGELQDFKRETGAKSEQILKQLAEERAAAEQKTLEGQAALIEGQLRALQERISRGGDLAAQEKQLMELTRQRGELEIRTIRSQLAADLAKQTDPKIRAELQKQADQAIVRSRQDTAQQIIQAEDSIRKATADRLRMEIDGERARKSIVDGRLEQLREQLARGENVGQQLREQLASQQKLNEAIAEREKKVRLATETDPAKRAQIEQAAQDELTASRQRYSQAERKTSEEIASAKLRDVSQAIDLQRREHQERMAQLEQRKAAGADVAAEEQALAREALRLRIEEIRVRQAGESVGKSAAEQARLQRQAELDIAQARRESKAALDAANGSLQRQTQEIQKQRDALKQVNDELQKLRGERDKDRAEKGPIIGGVEEMAKAAQRDAEISRLERQKRLQESSLSDAERTRRGVASNQAEGDRMGKTVEGRTPAEIARAEERDRIELGRAGERRQADERRRAGVRDGAAAPSSEASDPVLMQILSVLQTIASKPTTIDMRNNRPQTEQLPWQYKPNRAPGL